MNFLPQYKNQILMIILQVACEVCGVVFKCWSYLKTHLRSHEEHQGVQCKICHKSFKSDKHCQTHVLRSHRAPTFNCDQCGKGYNRARMLKEHIIAEHEKRRIWVCSYEGCDKAYYRKPHLNHHVRVIHLRQGPKEPTSL